MARSGLASTSSANKFHEVALAAMFALRQDVGGEREGEGPGTWGRMSVEFFKRAHRRSIGMAPLSRMNHSSGDMVSTGRQPANSVRERPKSVSKMQLEFRIQSLALTRITMFCSLVQNSLLIFLPVSASWDYFPHFALIF